MSNTISKHCVVKHQFCVCVAASLFSPEPDGFGVCFVVVFLIQILSAAATDADIGYNAIIHYAIIGETSSFLVGELSGNITTLQPLDYESRSEYAFLLRAFNPGEPSLQDTANITGSPNLSHKIYLCFPQGMFHHV